MQKLIDKSLKLIPPALCCALAISSVTVVALANSYDDGIRLYSQRNYRGAAQKFEQVVKSSPTDSNALYYLGVSYQAMGDVARARGCYEQVLRQFPGSGAAALAGSVLGVGGNQSPRHSKESSATVSGAASAGATVGGVSSGNGSSMPANLSVVPAGAQSLDALVQQARGSGIAPDPRAYFLAQNNDPRWNRDAPGNDANCGPTCLAMACKRYNIYPPTMNADTSVQQLILGSRFLVTGQANQAVGTNPGQWDQAMRKIGFKTAYISNLADIDKAISAGAVVAVGGCPWMDHSYGPRYHGTNKYPEFHNGHCILVVGKESGYFIVNDPLYFDGPINVGSGELDAFLSWNRARGIGIALFP